MKAWEVIGITHDGEIVCWDCMTKLERKVAEDKGDEDEIHPMFASDEEADEENCSRCGENLWENS